jgi:hypothetical protein
MASLHGEAHSDQARQPDRPNSTQSRWQLAFVCVAQQLMTEYGCEGGTYSSEATMRTPSAAQIPRGKKRSATKAREILRYIHDC